MTQILKFNNLESPAEFRSPWNGLAASVFQTLEWHECWWRCFGTEARELFVLVALASSAPRRLLGVAPLVLERERPGGIPRTTLRFLGSSNHASDYCDFLVAPGEPQVLTELLRAIHGQRSRWDVLELTHLPSHSPNRAAIEAFFTRDPELSSGSTPASTRSRPLPMDSRKDLDAPTRHLTEDIREWRSSGTAAVLNKKSLKRHFNSFQKSGQLEFRTVVTGEEAAPLLDEFFAQHIARRKLAAGTSIFLDDRQKRFYREVAQALGQAGWLRFSRLELDGRAIAFHFGFEFGGRFFWYKPTFDVSLVRKSPGEVLLRYLLQDAISRGLDEFDFTVGDEGFKLRFANEIRSNHRILVFGSTFEWIRFRMLRRLRGHLRQVKRGLRELLQPRSEPASPGQPEGPGEPAS